MAVRPSNELPVPRLRRLELTSHRKPVMLAIACLSALPTAAWATMAVTAGSTAGTYALSASGVHTASLGVGDAGRTQLVRSTHLARSGSVPTAPQISITLPPILPTASPTPSPTHSPTPSPTPSPTASPTPSPTHSPTPSPTSTAPSGTTMFGSTLLSTGGGVQAVTDKYGEAPPALRLFDGSSLKAPLSGTLNVIDTKYDASANPGAVTSWAKTLPDNAYVSYYHEPEDNIANGDFTAATYISKFRAFANAVRAGNPHVKILFNLMAWTIDSKSGRNWQDYYPGDAYVDVFGWDFDGVAPSSSSYPAFTDPLAKAPQIAQAHNKEWIVPEFTAARASWDSDGTARAAWLKSMAQKFVNEGASMVCLFDWPGVGGDAEPLKTPAEISAWSYVMPRDAQ